MRNRFARRCRAVVASRTAARRNDNRGMQLGAEEAGGRLVAGIACGPRCRRQMGARLALGSCTVVASRTSACRNARMVEDRSGPGRVALVACVACRSSGNMQSRYACRHRAVVASHATARRNNNRGVQHCAEEAGGCPVAGIARGCRGYVVDRLALGSCAVVASRTGSRRNARMSEGCSGPGGGVLMAGVA